MGNIKAFSDVIHDIILYYRYLIIKSQHTKTLLQGVFNSIPFRIYNLHFLSYSAINNCFKVHSLLLK
jgi:hypothetical protein